MLTKHSIVLLACGLLSSCGGENEIIVVNSGVETVFSLPEQLRNIAAVDSEDLTLEVRVNEQVVVLPPSESEPDLWAGIVNVPANRTSSIIVTWSYKYVTREQTYDLKLAERQKVIAIGTEPTSVDFYLGGYNTNHDQDDDGLSNLTEIEQSSSAVHRVDAYIGPDGAYPTGLPHPSSSECGTQFPIATLIQNVGDPAVEVPPEDLTAWWCANYISEQADVAGTNIPADSLKIVVNVLDDNFPITDGEIRRKYDDDSVEIFIDGNNSKGVNYDGVNDYQFVFLADGDNSVPLAKGPGAVLNLQSDVQFSATGYQLTVYIPREEVGIQHGQPFGLNVEVNDDDDGDLRDTKYSWIGKKNEDRSWTQPVAFGTAQIP